MSLPNKQRDVQGSYKGKESLAYRGGYLDRPIVDEDGALLRQWWRQAGVEVEEHKQAYSSIVLTHDVDTISHYRRWRGTLGAMRRMIKGSKERPYSILKAWQHIEYDPASTFPWLIAQDKKLLGARIICFLKASKHGAKQDYPEYQLKGKDCQRLFRLCKLTECTIGLHCSYASGDEQKRIKKERKRLRKASEEKITCARHHYLRALQPKDMHALIEAKITDDYTMGYADVAGF